MQGHKRNYLLSFLVGLVLFLVCLYLAYQHQLTGLQARIFYDFNNLPGSLATPALWLTEALGSGYAISAAVVLPLCFKRFRLAWRFFVVAAATGVVLEIGKLIAKEPRPVVLLGGHLHERAVEKGLTSFPSGHAAIATILALTLALILPRAWRWLAVVWIVIVAVSRLYLGVHTATDILGGFAIGLMVFAALPLFPENVLTLFRLDSNTPLLKKGLEGMQPIDKHKHRSE